MTERRVRVRFAPSPTGDLHVGGARTALFTWLFARHTGGDFILRVEDTDRRRYVEGSADGIVESLQWLGLTWDEGPVFQSERLPIYQEHARWLLDHGHAYECFCSPQRLDEVRAGQRARGEPPGYDRHCRNLSPDEVAAYRAEGITPVVRFKMPESGTTVVDDLIRGPITFENRLLEDPVILKSDGFPTYHLAAMVDDHLMEITHVTRAEEWLPSAPLHVQIIAAFGWEPPIFAHQPIILRPDGKGKLSKRDGSVGVLEYKRNGYLPEAMNNYLVLLGWSSGDQEFFTVDELIEKFSLEDVSASPARFSFDKLLWMNQHYINHVLSLEDLAARCVPYLVAAGLVSPAAVDPGSPEHARVREVVALVKDRLKTLTEVVELTSFFFTESTEEYEPATLVPRKVEPDAARNGLARARATLAEADFADEAGMEAALRGLAGELGLSAGQLFMPIRVAVTGRTVSPGLFETLRVLGRDRALARLDAAIAKLDGWSRPAA
ncbi:MAG TPA: glutamate--tRNA ligase [Thermomicrobiaceae bacterium]|nr:glutamate--tRNA ligase [Thermomicrobiaceae bacterium]